MTAHTLALAALSTFATASCGVQGTDYIPPPAQRTPEPKLGDARKDAHGVEQVRVPGGKFRMGTDGEPAIEPPKWAAAELASERPAHEVEITRAFWIDRTEVTVAQFEKFVADGGYAKRELWSE